MDGLTVGPMGLNPYLQPPHAPVAEDNSGVASPFDFGQNIKRDSITSTKIRNFSFNQGTGGTLTLGGNSNQNGRLVLRNSSGGTFLVIDSSGVNGTQTGSVTNIGTSIFTGAIAQRQIITLVAAGANSASFDSFFTNSSTPQGLDGGRFQLNPDNYPGNKFYIEAVYRAGTSGQAARTFFMDVYDITGGSAVANGTFSGTSQSGAGYGVYPRERSTTDFRPSLFSGNRDYMFRYWGTSSSGTLFVDLYEARLVIDF